MKKQLQATTGKIDRLLALEWNGNLEIKKDMGLLSENIRSLLNMASKVEQRVCYHNTE